MGVALGNDDGSAGAIGGEELELIRRELLTRLRSRSREVEDGIVAAVLGVEPGIAEDPDGPAGLRAAARATLKLIEELISQGVDWTPRLPAAIAAQTRYLARDGMPLEAVLRGHYAVIGACFEFATTEIAELPANTLPYLIEIQGRHGDYLMGSVSAEYEDELERLRSPTARRVEERVARLLAGADDVDSVLDYDLGDWHLGLIAVGAEVEQAARRLAERLGARLLMVPRGGETAWLWLGSARPIPFAELERHLGAARAEIRVAAGESRAAVEGWRLTHAEARAAEEVLRRGEQKLVRCADVLLLATVARDEEASRMLVGLYLGPLDADKDGARLRETLRAYYAGDCNAASAGAALGVDRQTVSRRLRKIEAALGRRLDSCRVEMEMALRVEAHMHHGATSAPPDRPT